MAARGTRLRAEAFLMVMKPVTERRTPVVKEAVEEKHIAEEGYGEVAIGHSVTKEHKVFT